MIAGAEWLSDRLAVAVPAAGVVFTPSSSGIELFLWAHGQADAGWQDIIDPHLRLEALEDLPTIDGAIDIADLSSANDSPSLP